MTIDDPFSGGLMSDGEVADCVDALLRTYGNGAGAFLVRELEGASSPAARSNWSIIANRYADLVEKVMSAHKLTLAEIGAKAKVFSNNMH